MNKFEIPPSSVSLLVSGVCLALAGLYFWGTPAQEPLFLEAFPSLAFSSQSSTPFPLAAPPALLPQEKSPPVKSVDSLEEAVLFALSPGGEAFKTLPSHEFNGLVYTINQEPYEGVPEGLNAQVLVLTNLSLEREIDIKASYPFYLEVLRSASCLPKEVCGVSAQAQTYGPFEGKLLEFL